MKRSVVVGFRRGPEVLNLGDPSDPSSVLMLTRGSKGFGTAPVDVASAPNPGGHGSRARGVRLTDRSLVVAARISHPDPFVVSATRAGLRDFLSPVRDDFPLMLQVTWAGMGTRELEVVCTGGLSGDDDDATLAVRHKLALEFWSGEAFWRGATVVKRLAVAQKSKPFLSPTIPFLSPKVPFLSSSTVAGVFDVVVEGDRPTAPIFTVTGPGQDLTLGFGKRKFIVKGDITEPITVNMVTGDIYTPTFTNGERWNDVPVGSDQMFELDPGPVAITVKLTAATNASDVTLTYEPRWLEGLE